MTATGTGEPGLRERKKQATRRALQRIALELVASQGLEQVTVEQIADAADVSARTFFNYFATKEDALVATDPDAVLQIRAQLAQRPAQESPLAALRAVYVERAERLVDQSEFWRLRTQVGSTYPDLFARMIGASASLERGVAIALADRMGVDSHDPRPTLVAGIGSAARRAATYAWIDGEYKEAYATILDRTFDQLPELILDSAQPSP